MGLGLEPGGDPPSNFSRSIFKRGFVLLFSYKHARPSRVAVQMCCVDLSMASREGGEGSASAHFLHQGWVLSPGAVAPSWSSKNTSSRFHVLGREHSSSLTQ